MEAAVRAFYNDSSMGVEEALRRFFAALTGACGMVAYGVVIGSRVPLLLVPLVLLTAASIAANRRANEKSFSVMDDEFATSEAFGYLKRQTLDAANGKDIRLYRMVAWFRRAFDQVLDRDTALRNVEYGAFERAEYVAAACALARRPRLRDAHLAAVCGLDRPSGVPSARWHGVGLWHVDAGGLRQPLRAHDSGAPRERLPRPPRGLRALRARHRARSQPGLRP